MVMADGHPAANIVAAGEIMAGNIVGSGYMAGIGTTIGSVFGRIAGQEAAETAQLSADRIRETWLAAWASLPAVVFIDPYQSECRRLVKV